jgi:hypothetical protein
MESARRDVKKIRNDSDLVLQLLPLLAELHVRAVSLILDTYLKCSRQIAAAAQRKPPGRAGAAERGKQQATRKTGHC